MTVVVRVVQQIVPHYRAPVFEALARVPGIQLEVWADYESEQDSIQSVAGSSAFTAEHAPVTWRGPFFTQPRAMEALMEDPCDVLIASWHSRDLGLSRLLTAARRTKCRTVLWGHGFGKTVPVLGSFLRNRLISKADGLLFYGPSARDRFLAMGVAAEKLFVAPNAIDQSPIRSARRAWLENPDRLDAFRRESGIGESPTVIYVGRLEAGKSLDVLVRAWAHVRTRVPAARLILVGKGSLETPMRCLAESLGITDAITFTGGIFDDHELAPWCLGAKAFVHPGGIGLGIFHGFGFGLPVVTTDAIDRHFPEFEAFRDGFNGLTYRDRDPVSLGDRLSEILLDDALQRRLAYGACETVDGRGGRDIPGMVDGFVAAIDALTAGRRVSAASRAA